VETVKNIILLLVVALTSIGCEIKSENDKGDSAKYRVERLYKRQVPLKVTRHRSDDDPYDSYLLNTSTNKLPIGWAVRRGNNGYLEFSEEICVDTQVEYIWLGLSHVVTKNVNFVDAQTAYNTNPYGYIWGERSNGTDTSNRILDYYGRFANRISRSIDAPSSSQLFSSGKRGHLFGMVVPHTDETAKWEKLNNPELCKFKYNSNDEPEARIIRSVYLGAQITLVNRVLFTNGMTKIKYIEKFRERPNETFFGDSKYSAEYVYENISPYVEGLEIEFIQSGGDDMAMLEQLEGGSPFSRSYRPCDTKDVEACRGIYKSAFVLFNEQTSTEQIPTPQEAKEKLVINGIQYW